MDVGPPQPAATSTYVYRPLSALQTIRLLYLTPGLRGEPIIARLAIVALQNAPHYEAMSYTWGDSSPTTSISIEGFPLSIRNNLYKGLLRVRNESTVRILWADAVCINQSDINERSNQVSIMGLIFERASQVLVYLGDDEHEEGALAMSLLKKIEQRLDNELMGLESYAFNHVQAGR